MSDRTRAEALRVLAASGDHPLMRSFPQGAVFAWDHDLRYLSAGGRGLAEVGLSRQMLEGRTIFEALPVETASMLEPLYRAALRGESTTIDVPFGGRIFSQRLSPVLDESGQIVAGMGFTQDVSDVRAAETALRESEERARLSFQHAPIGEALVELDGRWREVNPALTKLTGYTESELLGMTFQDITHPEDLDADLQQLEQLLAGEIASYQIEKRYLTASGAVVWVLLAVSLVTEDGRPLYLIAQIQDVTELKRQHDALEDLIAVLAHDLRTPLTSVVGFAELLGQDWDGDSDAERRSLAARIVSSGQAMERLVDSTLTVSTLAAHTMTTNPQPVKVDQVAGEALGLLADSNTSVDMSGLQPLMAWVDPAQLNQALTNLFTNAIKYGGGEITVAARETAGTVQLTISDRGPGVPPDFVPYLFDRFVRSQEAQDGPQRGSGLGLYIVQQLMSINNGSVIYSPNPGGGAAFTLSLPQPPKLPPFGPAPPALDRPVNAT